MTTRERIRAVWVLMLLVTLPGGWGAEPVPFEAGAVPLPKPIRQWVQTAKYAKSWSGSKAYWLLRGDVPQGGPLGERYQSGNMRLLVALIKSRYGPAPFPKEYVARLVFGPNTAQEGGALDASIAGYYRGLSGGRVEIQGQVLEWQDIEDTDPKWSGCNDGAFIDRIATICHTNANFAAFDRDGLSAPAPGQKTDGNVDCFIIICAPLESTPPRAYRNKYSLCVGSQRKPWKPQEGGTGVEDFIVVPSSNLLGDGIGLLAHEVGHFLGLPDLYRRTVSSPTDVGHWCVMCWGCVDLSFGTASRFPSLFSAWCRDFLGWGRSVGLVPGQSAQLRSMREGDYCIISGVGDPEEKLLVELYTPPTDNSPWGKGMLPATQGGFLLWHLDEHVGKEAHNPDFEWPSTDVSAGQNDMYFAPAVLSKQGDSGGYTNHPLLRLIQADGSLGLEDASSMRPLASQLFGTGVLWMTNRSKGFGLYRSSESIGIGFDLDHQTVSVYKSIALTNVTEPVSFAGDTYVSGVPGGPPSPSMGALVPESTSQRVAAHWESFSSGPSVGGVRGGGAGVSAADSEGLLAPSEDGVAGSVGSHALALSKRVFGVSNKVARALISEDGERVLGVAGLNASLNGTSVAVDAMGRSNQIRQSLGIRLPEISVAIRTNSESVITANGLQKIPFSCVIKTGGRVLPVGLSSGSIEYANGKAFIGYSCDHPIQLKDVPMSIEPRLTATAVENDLAGKFGIAFPAGTKFSSRLEVFPTGLNRDHGQLAYEVKILMPHANPVYAHVDATTGEPLP